MYRVWDWANLGKCLSGFLSLVRILVSLKSQLCGYFSFNPRNGIRGCFTASDYDLPPALAGIDLPAADSFFKCVIFGILGTFKRVYPKVGGLLLGDAGSCCCSLSGSHEQRGEEEIRFPDRRDWICLKELKPLISRKQSKEIYFPFSPSSLSLLPSVGSWKGLGWSKGWKGTDTRIQ